LNALAHVGSFTRMMEHIRTVLKQLYWLPISFHIDYKIATLVAYNALETGCPDYRRQPVLLLHTSPTFELRQPTAIVQSSNSTGTSFPVTSLRTR